MYYFCQIKDWAQLMCLGEKGSLVDGFALKMVSSYGWAISYDVSVAINDIAVQLSKSSQNCVYFISDHLSFIKIDLCTD